MRLMTVIAILLACTGVASAQERWAAQASSNESNAPVAWGETREEASDNALAACRRVSDTCGSRPATTDNMKLTFITMCCAAPRIGCAITGSEAAARKIFADAGFSSCRVTRRTNAGTGR